MQWTPPKTDFTPKTPISDTFLNNLGNNLLWLKNRFQVFTSSGVFEVPDGVNLVYLIMSGAGGGGGGSYRRGSVYPVSSGGLGGNGEIAFMRPVVVTPKEIINIAIGIGGAGGAHREGVGVIGYSGADGGVSSFGSYVVCSGGGGGQGGSESGAGTAGASYSTEGFFRQYGYRGNGGYINTSSLDIIGSTAGVNGICIVLVP